jgi:dTDP-4-dehydrorhamnose reductase
MPEMIAPPEQAPDITVPETIQVALELYKPTVLLHAAAYTNVAGAEQEKAICWRVNVEGTRNLVQAIAGRDMFFIHISTDYVFEGTRGMYKEDDPIGPVRNYYSLSKLVAEELARFAQNHLVLRTSFRPKMWPYPIAFTDVYTSQDYVDIIAPEIALAVQHCREIPYRTLHIATERKSVYELAKRRKPDVQPGSKKDARVELPDDISLDTSLWQNLKKKWK